MIRAIGVEYHTPCKYELRRNPRSHSWSVFYFCVKNGGGACVDDDGVGVGGRWVVVAVVLVVALCLC